MTEHKLRGSTDWDVIELNFQVDVEKLKDWYYAVQASFPNLRFNVGMMKQFCKDDQTQIVLQNFKSKNLEEVSNIHSYGMSWPVETDLPIPPKFACRQDLYPEAYDPNFEENLRIMSRYKFGYFKDLLEMLGEKTLDWGRITIHEPNAAIENHTDGPTTIRLHIPIVTNQQAYFCWGEQKERKYVFQPGSVYLINTSIVHSTINEGATERAHIISHPTNVDWLLTHRR
jgi:hypothetical protein